MEGLTLCGTLSLQVNEVSGLSDVHDTAVSRETLRRSGIFGRKRFNRENTKDIKVSLGRVQGFVPSTVICTIRYDD